MEKALLLGNQAFGDLHATYPGLGFRVSGLGLNPGALHEAYPARWVLSDAL